eukprot:2508756-Alexandrium_andersonii.AAC.1
MSQTKNLLNHPRDVCVHVWRQYARFTLSREPWSSAVCRIQESTHLGCPSTRARLRAATAARPHSHRARKHGLLTTEHHSTIEAAL